MGDLIGASIIGGLFGLGGSAANASAQKAANETNLKIAQMNNEFNERMLQKQMDYNTEMWNKQNAYNSASSQRQRLEAAGLNPYMMMSGGSAGTAQSAGGVNPPTATPVSVQPVQYDLSTAAGFVQQAIDLQSVQGQRDADANLKNRQAEQIHIENQYKAADVISQIVQRMSDTKNKKLQSEYQSILNQFAPSLFSSDVNIKQRTAANIEMDSMLKQAQTSYQLLQGRLTEKQLQYFDQKTLMELSVMAAQQYALYASGRQSLAQAQQAISNSLESQARTRGIKIDNHVKKALINTTIGTAQQAYRQQYYNAELSKKENSWYWYNNSIGPIVNNLVPMAVGFGLGKFGMPKPVKIKGFGR